MKAGAPGLSIRGLAIDQCGGGGLRVSELVHLKWRDLQGRDDDGQVSVFGKGGKTRHVLLSKGTWDTLSAIRSDASEDGPVFVSRKGSPLSTSQAFRIVRAAARRAGVEMDVIE